MSQYEKTVLASHQGQTKKSKQHAGDIFTIDRKGDGQNSLYGADKYKIPRYHLAGHGSLIGLDRRFKQISTKDGQREIDNTAADIAARNRHQSSLKSKLKNSTSLDHVRGLPDAHHDFDLQKDYISVSGRKRRRTRERDSDHENLEHGHEEQPSSSDSEDGPVIQSDYGNQAFDDFRSSTIQRQDVELRRLTTTQPSNVNVWLWIYFGA